MSNPRDRRLPWIVAKLLPMPGVNCVLAQFWRRSVTIWSRILSAAFLLALSPSVCLAQQFNISTIAGGVLPSTPVAATSVSIGFPKGIALDSSRNIYFSALNVVWKIDTSGTLTRVAGTGRAGYSGDGGPATSAQISLPADWQAGGLAVDSSGNLYIADSSNSRVRMISTSGIISTIAGGNCCNSAEGVLATTATLSTPWAVAVDSSGNIYIADTGTNKVRQVSTSGTITTVAGNGSAGYTGDGGPATNAQLSAPRGIALDSAGNLYIADRNNNRIRKVFGGTITTVAGGGASLGDGGAATGAQLNQPSAVALDSSGNLYIADTSNNRIREVSGGTITTVVGGGSSGDGSSATSASLSTPLGVAVDSSGNLYMSDGYDCRIRKVAGGIISTVGGNGLYGYSGDGGPANLAQLGLVSGGIAMDPSGNLYIAERFQSRVRRVAVNGTITTFAGTGGGGFSGDNGPATAAKLNSPYGLAFDSSGNLYIADTSNNRIREVSTSGQITTIAGTGNSGFGGDGGPATSAQLAGPQGVGVDSSGNIYIADTGNNRVRRISGGTISTVAGTGVAGSSGDNGPATSATLNGPQGVMADTAGNLYVSDTNSYRIRKIDTAGAITAYAGKGSCCYSGDGGPALAAQIGAPAGLAMDGGGNFYFADGVSAVRVISPGGIINTVAGNGTGGYSGDGGPANVALVGATSGVAVDASGNVYAVSWISSEVRFLQLLPLAVGTTSLPTAYNSFAYSANLTAIGGHVPYTWSLASGSLPNGLSLSAAGVISGTPTATGTFTFKVQVTDATSVTASATLSIAVNNGPAITAGGIVNGASFTAPIVPGSAAVIYGNALAATAASNSPPLATTLNGTSVTMNGIAVPLSYVSPTQIRFQVPWELAGQTSASVIVTTSRGASSAISVRLAAMAPGIFTTNGLGTGQGSIYNPDHLQNSSSDPAHPGVQIQLFAVGLGAVSNQPADGAVAGQNSNTSTLPTVTIGGIQATVVAAGLSNSSSYFYQTVAVGSYQVIVTVPAGVAAGSSVPVVLTAGGIGSNTATMVIAPYPPLVVIAPHSYYVSTSGSDSNPGTLSQPFQTIQKAASAMVAGDTTFIRAGIYRETVVPANSGTQMAPITFRPYNNESVTVSGADLLPAGSWALSSGSIYKAGMAWDLGDGANQVFLDGQMMTEARWPNTTLDVSHPTVAQTTAGSHVDGGSGLSTATITDPNLPSRPAGYWNGAAIHLGMGLSWSWQTGSVVSAGAGQLSFTYVPIFSGSLTPSANNQYYLTGKLGELDSPGEWFRDSSSSTLYFWTPQGDTPAQHTVEAKHRQLAFDLSGRAFITIQGLGLFAATVNSDAQSQYLVLDSLKASYIAHDPVPVNLTMSYAGIALRGNNNVFRNSTIAFSSSNGVYLEGTGQRVINNVIHDVDYNPTYSSPVSAGTALAQSQQLIAYNSIYNSGRFGIYHSSNFGQGRILHNDIYNFGLQTNDLGCTYTWGTDGQGTEIAFNLCHDGHGLPWIYGFPLDVGIYLDNNSSNFIVHHNVIWNIQWALNLGDPNTNEKVYNNTFVGIASGLASGNDHLPGTQIENNIFVTPIVGKAVGAVITNNILPGTDPQFVDPTNHNYQLKPTSPAIAAGAILPPYTDGYSGSAPDIGAYDHTKPPWKAGAQAAAYTVSAASYGPAIAPGSIPVVFGTVPFDAAATVVVTDGAGIDRPATPLYVVASPPQLAFVVPDGAAPGVGMVTITNGDGTVSVGTAPIFPVAPGLFSADASGQGIAAAGALRVTAAGSQTYAPSCTYNAAQGAFVPTPIDLSSPTDQVYLVLYGTGIRGRSALSNVSATIGNTALPVAYAGSQGQFVGLDQVNILLPTSLAGAGTVNVVLGVDGQAANVVTVTIK
jgi:uncharacterized protein (TIGR03437 family)